MSTQESRSNITFNFKHPTYNKFQAIKIKLIQENKMDLTLATKQFIFKSTINLGVRLFIM